jgi:hypothetical protein
MGSFPGKFACPFDFSAAAEAGAAEGIAAAVLRGGPAHASPPTQIAASVPAPTISAKRFIVYPMRKHSNTLEPPYAQPETNQKVPFDRSRVPIPTRRRDVSVSSVLKPCLHCGKQNLDTEGTEKGEDTAKIA